MVKISASFVFTGAGQPIRNSIIEIDKSGTVLSVTGGSESITETGSLIYNSGILIPGLVDVNCGNNPDDLYLYTRGVRVAGIVSGPASYEWEGIYGGKVDYRNISNDHFNRAEFNDDSAEGLYNYHLNGENLLVLAGRGSKTMYQLMFNLQLKNPEMGFSEILKIASLNGAIALGCKNFAGTIEPGKQPGLVLIEGADLKNFKLLPSTTFRRVI